MLSLQDIKSINELVEEIIKKHAITTYPFKVCPILSSEGALIQWHDLPPRVDSICTIDKPSCKSIIFINSRLQDNINRLRFTLAHEAGHICTFKNNMLYTEDKCDAFAACLLMPEKEFRHIEYRYGLKECTQHFKVSHTAASYRLQHLKLYEKEKLQARFLSGINTQSQWFNPIDLMPEPWMGI